MTKDKMLNEIKTQTSWNLSIKKHVIIQKFEERIAGKKGSPEKRDQFATNFVKIATWRKFGIKSFANIAQSREKNHEKRLKTWRYNQAIQLADKAGQNYDEHGYTRGDYMRTRAIDYISPREGSFKKPYCDMGGEGLALVSVSRTRVYAKCANCSPSTDETRYLVGKNEVGTYFAHPVSKNCNDLKSALKWIWSGKEDLIIERQGDIALIWGAGPKYPSYIPRGHKLLEDKIIHDTHPDLPLPLKGQRIIVGCRAVAKISEATRD